MKKINTLKYILKSNFFLCILFFFISCASEKKHPIEQPINQPQKKEVLVFSEEKKILNYNFIPENNSTITLDQTQVLNFHENGQPVEIKNILKENQTLPETITTKAISRVVNIEKADRFILKIRYDKGPQFILPFLSNDLKVQLPVKLIYEKTDELSNLHEKNFLIQIPQSGEYTIHFLSFAPEKSSFESNFYFGHEQNGVKSTETHCASKLAYNLRHCIPTECTVDMTESFKPLDIPPEKVLYHYKIKKLQNHCQTSVESNINESKECKIPIEFNPLIQDCGYPMKDANFAKKINLLNQKFFSAETPQDILETSSLVQKLWLNDYPISLMCSKELDFQLPDLDQLMEGYCKTTPSKKENARMLEWKNELETKIAVKHATLNFKSLTLNRENSENSHNIFIEESDTIKKLTQKCFQQNEVSSCKDLSKMYSENNEDLQAGETSAKACNLGDALSCQKAGLSLTQAKKRKSAQQYEIKGCKLKDSISCYNVACGYCVSGNVKMALLYFKKHLSLGVEDPMHIIFDPTIQCIKKTTVFENFLQKTLAP